jgi:hypothetical protein
VFEYEYDDDHIFFFANNFLRLDFDCSNIPFSSDFKFDFLDKPLLREFNPLALREFFDCTGNSFNVDLLDSVGIIDALVMQTKRLKIKIILKKKYVYQL